MTLIKVGMLLLKNLGYSWNISITIRGHSVKTRKEEFERGESLATGDAGILDMEGLAIAPDGLRKLDALILAAATSMVIDSFESEGVVSNDGVPLEVASDGDPAARAGNKKFLWTAAGKDRYEF